MKFFRRTAGYTIFERKRNKEILEELTVEAYEEKLRRFKSKCLGYVTRMNDKRIKN
jgi:hypothetical protein